jgi:hypothetical protein
MYESSNQNSVLSEKGNINAHKELENYHNS